GKPATEVRSFPKASLFNGLPKPWTPKFARLCTHCQTSSRTADIKGSTFEMVDEHLPQIGIEPKTRELSQIELSPVATPHILLAEPIQAREAAVAPGNLAIQEKDSDVGIGNLDSQDDLKEIGQPVSVLDDARFGDSAILNHTPSFNQNRPSSLYTLEEEDEEEFPTRSSTVSTAKPPTNVRARCLGCSEYTTGILSEIASCFESNSSSNSEVLKAFSFDKEIPETPKENGDEFSVNSPGAGTILLSTESPSNADHNSKPCP